MFETLADNVATFCKTGYLELPLLGVIFVLASWVVVITAFAVRCKSKYPKIS
jgi:hypothetical protein